MKQTMVIKVQMHCDKCRAKALKIAAATHGVSQVAIQGAERDQLMVSGDEVDSVKLTCSLRKKLHYATILSVEEKKEEKKKEKQEEKNPDKEDNKNTPSCYVHCPPPVFIPVEDPCRATPCPIL